MKSIKKFLFAITFLFFLVPNSKAQQHKAVTCAQQIKIFETFVANMTEHELESLEKTIKDQKISDEITHKILKQRANISVAEDNALVYSLLISVLTMGACIFFAFGCSLRPLLKECANNENTECCIPIIREGE